MAKGLRSSVKKANKAKLRSRVFKPVEDARTERLSAKLLELASSKRQPEKEKEAKMDDVPEAQISQRKQADPDTAVHTQEEVMEMDDGELTAASATAPAPKGASRIQKRGRGKASSSMVFPVYKKGKRAGSGKKSRR